MKTGVELIAEERWNQVYNHGYNREHDEEHRENEIAIHAALLILHGIDGYKIMDEREVSDIEEACDEWGILDQFNERVTEAEKQKLFAPDLYRVMIKQVSIDQLKVAGALIAAEIDRLQNQNQ